MWCDTLSLSEWVSYVPARDGCTLLLGATVPSYYGLECVLWRSFFFTHHSLLNDTKCSFMGPLLSFSNSRCGSDNTVHSGDFLLVAVCLLQHVYSHRARGKVKPAWFFWIGANRFLLCIHLNLFCVMKPEFEKRRWHLFGYTPQLSPHSPSWVDHFEGWFNPVSCLGAGVVGRIS